jgi:hypothetical protein
VIVPSLERRAQQVAEDLVDQAAVEDTIVGAIVFVLTSDGMLHVGRRWLPEGEGPINQIGDLVRSKLEVADDA